MNNQESLSLVMSGKEKKETGPVGAHRRQSEKDNKRGRGVGGP